MDAIRNDPGYNDGEYKQQPAAQGRTWVVSSAAVVRIARVWKVAYCRLLVATGNLAIERAWRLLTFQSQATRCFSRSLVPISPGVREF